MKNKILKVSLTGVALAIFGVIGFQQFKAMKIAEFMANMPEKENVVEVMKIEKTDWQPIIKTTGVIKPIEGTTLTIQSTGVIKELFFKSGQEVKKGDVILALDNAVENAQLEALKVQLQSAQSTLSKYEGLIKTKSISRETYDQAFYAVKNLQASIKSSEANIERRKVVAPFSGKLGIVSLSVGDYLTTGTSITSLENNSKMKVEFSLAQNDLEKLKIGQNINFKIDGLGLKEHDVFTGKISALEQTVNLNTGLIKVEALVDNNDQNLISKLKSGMFAKVNVELDKKLNQFVLPQASISYALYGENAFIVKTSIEKNKENKEESKDRAKRVVLKSLDKNDNSNLVSFAKGESGEDLVKEGDLLIISGIQRLSDNSLIKIQNVDKDNGGLSEVKMSKPLELKDKL